MYVYTSSAYRLLCTSCSPVETIFESDTEKTSQKLFITLKKVFVNSFVEQCAVNKYVRKKTKKKKTACSISFIMHSVMFVCFILKLLHFS